MGGSASGWNKMAEKVSAFTTTFAFERPGYGGTPLAPSDADGIRTGDEVAALLRAALKKNAIRRPVVLVAHSLGSQYALRYARLHPRDVAGMVLLDGRMKDHTARCVAAGMNCAPPQVMWGMSEPMAAEVRGLAVTEAATPDPAELGGFPITVVSANKGPQPGLALWQESQRLFASAVKNGRFLIAEKSGHIVHRDEPELVLSEIRSVVERASSKR
jgi:pimeloyl-ACP methyl ester carboxylesterase